MEAGRTAITGKESSHADGSAAGMLARAALLGCSVALLFAGCDQEGMSRSYKGTAAIAIDYFEYDAQGAPALVEHKTFSKAVQVLIGPPKAAGLIAEENPFNISITAGPTTGEEGELWLTSALVLVDAILGDVLLQYWTLETNNAAVSGVLTDTHIAEAAAMNQLWALDEVARDVIMAVPFFIDKGATLQGTVSEGNVQLRITGTSTDKRRPFTADIAASHEP